MKSFIMLLLISEVLLFTPGQCFSEGPENKSIAVMDPGIGIGNIKIGDQLQDVIARMGRKPSDGKTVSLANNRTEYWLDFKDLGITFIFDEKRELQRIAVSNPGIIIRSNGIRVDNSVNDIERVYGDSEVKKINEQYIQRIYRDKGVGFTINVDTGKIEAITIEKNRR